MSHQPVMKRTCANCPFRKAGAIELRPGRVEEIAALTDADDGHFVCHKSTGGRRSERKGCMGFMAYAARAGRISVVTRLAIALGLTTMKGVEANYPDLIDPIREQDRAVS